MPDEPREFSADDVCSLIQSVFEVLQRPVSGDLHKLHAQLTDIWMERVETVEVHCTVVSERDSTLQAAFRQSSTSWKEFQDITKEHLKVCLDFLGALPSES